jgi:hypothetical protein
MLNFILVLLVVNLLSFGGCASLQSVSLSPVPIERTKKIEAEGWTWGLLGIYFSNSFADEAIDQLRAKCPGGKISGIYTKYETRLYPLWSTRQVTASGYCVNADGMKKTTKSAQEGSST